MYRRNLDFPAIFRYLVCFTSNYTMHYFFSDAHLGAIPGPADTERERTIVRFLESIAPTAKSLFIVGDLFDYWFEYATVVPKGYVRLLGTLATMSDNGTRLYYLCGNHDFWMRGYLRQEVGFEIHPDALDVTLDGKRFFVHHGDGFQKNDTGYLTLKRVFRNKTNIRVFSWLHPDIATGISRFFSRKSRERSSALKKENKDLIEFAIKKIDEGFDYVVMGHSHDPLYQQVGNGAFVNLGDWISHYSYAQFDGTRLTLRYRHKD